MEASNFDKARVCRRLQKLFAIALLLFCGVNLIKFVVSKHRSCDSLPNIIAASAVVISSIGVLRFARCPECGKSLMTTWLGRDGAGRNCIRRIEKSLSVRCPHCGAEVETA